MADEFRAAMRAQLLRLREQSAAMLAGREREVDAIIAASRDSNADDEHDPEGATIGFERAQASSLAVRARERLREIDAALARIDADTYGGCVRCGRDIDEARLRARPYARLCVDCQRDQD